MLDESKIDGGEIMPTLAQQMKEEFKEEFMQTLGSQLKDEGKKEGIEEKAIETAKKMLKKGFNRSEKGRNRKAGLDIPDKMRDVQ
jgi:predicted Zn-dependent peptidase